jgi:L-fuculose-phosphate aldolase
MTGNLGIKALGFSREAFLDCSAGRAKGRTLPVRPVKAASKKTNAQKECPPMTTELAMACQSEKVKTEMQQRKEMCRVGRWMYSRAYVVANEGNLSVRLGEDRILVTPAGVCKGRLASKDLLITNLMGDVVSGMGRPSSELKMHLLYYRSRPDVHAICHAHPPTATGFAAAGRALEEAVLPEVIVCLGRIPLAPYATPGTRELCAGLEPLLPNYDAILLENHGVVTCGPNLAIAYERMEIVEQFARVMVAAESLGGPHLLPRAEVQKLIAARQRYGVSSPGGGLELPLKADSAEHEVTFSAQARATDVVRQERVRQ